MLQEKNMLLEEVAVASQRAENAQSLENLTSLDDLRRENARLRAKQADSSKVVEEMSQVYWSACLLQSLSARVSEGLQPGVSAETRKGRESCGADRPFSRAGAAQVEVGADAG